MHLFIRFLGSYVATWGFAILGNSHIKSIAVVKSSVGYFSLAHRMKSLQAGILGSWFSLCLILHVYARVYRAEELEGQCQLWVLTHLETHIKRTVVISKSFLGAVFYLPCVFVARMSQ